MFRTLALYGASEARRRSDLIAAITSKPRPVLALLHLQFLPGLSDVCSKHQQGSSRQQAATHQHMAGLISTLVSFQAKCIGTVSGSSKYDSSSVSHSNQTSSNNAAKTSGHQPTQSNSSKQAEGDMHEHSASKAQMQHEGQQLLQNMYIALRRKDYKGVKRLFDPHLADQASLPRRASIWSSTCACMQLERVALFCCSG